MTLALRVNFFSYTIFELRVLFSEPQNSYHKQRREFPARPVQLAITVPELFERLGLWVGDCPC